MNFYINQEKRTIVCLIDNCQKDVINTIQKSFPLSEDFFMGHGINLNMGNKYVGVAKCSPLDAWNVDIGVKIAKTRALYKYQKDYLKTIGGFMNYYEDCFLKFQKRESNCCSKIYDYCQKINGFKEGKY